MLKNRIDRPAVVFAIVVAVFVACALLVPVKQTASDVGYAYNEYENQQISPLHIFWDWITKDSISFFTVLLVLVSGWQGVLILRAERSTQRALRTAREQVEVTRLIGEAQTRAYIGAHNIEVTDFRAGHAPKFKYNPTNTGQTPAYNLTILSGLFFTSDNPEQFKVRFGAAQSRSRIVLSNGQLVSQDMKGPVLNQGQYLLCVEQKAFVILAGKMRYRDVFNHWHRTTFMAYVDPGILDGWSGKLSSTGKHNQAS